RPMGKHQDLARSAPTPRQVVEALRRTLPTDPAVDQRINPVGNCADPFGGVSELRGAVGEGSDQGSLLRAQRVRGKLQSWRTHPDQHDPAPKTGGRHSVGNGWAEPDR